MAARASAAQVSVMASVAVGLASRRRINAPRRVRSSGGRSRRGGRTDPAPVAHVGDDALERPDAPGPPDHPEVEPTDSIFGAVAPSRHRQSLGANLRTRDGLASRRHSRAAKP
jgi:hypothetical protein